MRAWNRLVEGVGIVKQEDVWRHLDAEHPTARIAYHYSPRSRWVYATIETRDRSIEYNHRSVLPTEVVFDLDAATEDENFCTLKKLSGIFREYKIFNSIWHTGGKGYHIHTFWNRLDTVSEPRLLKEKLFEWLTNGVEGSFDRQLLGNHLVRMEYGKYEKAYPKEKMKLPVLIDNHFKHNEIPQCVWDDYAHDVLKYALKRLNHKPGDERDNGVRPCVKYILSPEFKTHKDGAKRALFAVASYYRNREDDKLMEILKTFNSYNLKEPYTERQLQVTIKSVRDHKGRPCGCAFRHSLLKEIGAKEVAEKCEAGR
jgi:hypothetical protein